MLVILSAGWKVTMEWENERRVRIERSNQISQVILARISNPGKYEVTLTMKL